MADDTACYVPLPDPQAQAGMSTAARQILMNHDTKAA